MSVPAARRFSSACPSAVRRLHVTDFLFRDSASHQYESPGCAGRPSRRRSSPTPGCSTLMTSAPNSPRSVAQTGAARNVARSRTVTPASAGPETLTAASYRLTPPRPGPILGALTREPVRVLVKRLDAGVPIPAYAREGDAGLDLHAAQDVTLAPGARALVATGIAVALPPGCAGFVVPRSGLALRH